MARRLLLCPCGRLIPTRQYKKEARFPRRAFFVALLPAGFFVRSGRARERLTVTTPPARLQLALHTASAVLHAPQARFIRRQPCFMRCRHFRIPPSAFLLNRDEGEAEPEVAEPLVRVAADPARRTAAPRAAEPTAAAHDSEDVTIRSLRIRYCSAAVTSIPV